MKFFNLLTIYLTLTALFAISVVAQTEKKSSSATTKIAEVNSKTFEDKKLGIKDLIIAWDKVEIKVKPRLDEMNASAAKLEETRKEIERDNNLANKDWTGHSNLYSKAKAKFEEYQKLASQFESKIKDYKVFLEKLESEIVNPVNDKIGKALEQFRIEKDYWFILDSSQNYTSVIIIDGEVDDITSEFIKFCNESFEKEKTQ